MRVSDNTSLAIGDGTLNHSKFHVIILIIRSVVRDRYTTIFLIRLQPRCITLSMNLFSAQQTCELPRQKWRSLVLLSDDEINA